MQAQPASPRYLLEVEAPGVRRHVERFDGGPDRVGLGLEINLIDDARPALRLGTPITVEVGDVGGRVAPRRRREVGADRVGHREEADLGHVVWQFQQFGDRGRLVEVPGG